MFIYGDLDYNEKITDLHDDLNVSNKEDKYLLNKIKNQEEENMKLIKVIKIHNNH